MKTHTLLRNTKALSPVIATIILVAVTVAIAIAVAAWLGALTFTYTNTEQVSITSAVITIGTSPTTNVVTLGLSNSGTSDVIIASGTVTGGAFNTAILATSASPGCSATGSSTNFGATVSKGSSCSLVLTLSSGVTGNYVAGTSYQFKLVSTKGHTFLTTTSA